MSDIVIKSESLGKKYTIGHQAENDAYMALRDVVAQNASNLWRKIVDLAQGKPIIAGDTSEDIWALKDVSFEIRRGEAVGIIGRNGAGKSTLLKILSRITDPSAGRVTIKGRVSSLLEVGTGFHPELTGRENIFLNGAILGMTRSEIRRKFDEIVAFAEVERFLDTPVKRYSSGMFVRLAFAVAAHLEPEILIVDEVLAVGDATFQRKCLGKMGDVSKEGRTVLFVSHNMIAVQSLCARAIWLRDGQVAEDGDVSQVVSSYLNTSFSTVTERVWDVVHTAPGNDKVRIRYAGVRPEAGSPSDAITIEAPIVLEFEYWNLQPGACLNLSLHLYNEQGIVVFNTGPVREPVWNGKPFPFGLFRSTCRIPGDLLNDGTHRLELLVVEDQSVVIFANPDILAFDVRDVGAREGWYGKWAGAVRPNLEWKTEFIGATPAVATGVARQEMKL